MYGPEWGFKECETCAAKPGSPTLCEGCQNNREVITTLFARLSDLDVDTTFGNVMKLLVKMSEESMKQQDARYLKIATDVVPKMSEERYRVQVDIEKV